VVDTERNAALLTGVAETFRDAVLEFCDHPTLQYQWMRFLPRDCFDGFWRMLGPKVKELLTASPILRPYGDCLLKMISQLKVIPEEFKDKAEKPLFDESSEIIYLAPEYEPSDINFLRPFGLANLTAEDVISIVKKDVSSPTSRLKLTIDNDWHIRVSKFLVNFSRGKCIRHLRNIPLIPLEGAEWSSTIPDPIFFPQTDDINIPTDLGLRLVKREAINGGAARRMLFSKLGVTYALSSHVRSLIFRKYNMPETRATVNLDSSVAHLRYLYWTHRPLSWDIRISASIWGQKNPTTSTAENSVFGDAFGGSSGVPRTASTSVPGSSTGLFGRAVPALRDESIPCPGTGEEEFNATVIAAPDLITQKDSFQSICVQMQYRAFSPEELRLADYGEGLRYGGPIPCPGTGGKEFNATVIEVPGLITEKVSFQSICVQMQYRAFSPEELRLADYEEGRRYGGAIPCPGTGRKEFNATVIAVPGLITQKESFQSICVQMQYRAFSPEELRLTNYEEGHRYSDSSVKMDGNVIISEKSLGMAYQGLWLYNHNGKLVPCKDDIYLKSSDEFGVHELCKQDNAKVLPKLAISLLNSAYFTTIPVHSVNFMGLPSWEEWLHESIGILCRPRLRSLSDPSRLSEVFQYIVKNLPEKLLGTLKAHWASYVNIMSTDIEAEISNVEVPCIDAEKTKLKRTFMPSLHDYCKTFLREKEFPFLLLYPEADAKEWEFLTRFSVGYKEDLDLHLSILNHIRQKDRRRVSDPERVIKIYENIQATFVKCGRNPVDQKKIK
jgi:hypothetical protein